MRTTRGMVSGLMVSAVAILLLSVMCGLGLAADESGFEPIFDGKSLDGWEIMYMESGRPLREQGSWKVVDGAIQCNGLGEYWLRYSKEQLDNCVIRLQYKLTEKANSGVVLRSTEKGVPWHTGFEVQIIDDVGKRPTKHTTGSIYDVVTPMYNESKPIGEWNDMEIVTCGKVVKVSVNGLKVVDVDFGMLTYPIGKYRVAYNDLPLKGFLCLQDHGGKLWYRNIRVKKLPAPACGSTCPKAKAAGRCPSGKKPPCGAAKACCKKSVANEEGFETIFNGPDSKGWAVYNHGAPAEQTAFKVIDDFVRCTATAKGENYYRYEKEMLGNFILRGEYRTQAHVNSGILLRTKAEGVPYMTGFEIQILEDYGKEPGRHGSGAVYDVATTMFNAVNPAGWWNEFEITMDGGLVTVVLNGWKVIDTDFSKLTTRRGKFKFPYSEMPKQGYLCLQDHGGIVDFRNMRVKKLD